MAINPNLIGDPLADQTLSRGGNTNQNTFFQAPREFNFGNISLPVSSLTSGGVDRANQIIIGRRGASLFAGGPGTGASGAAGRSNFNLNKSTTLRDLALQRQELERQRKSGLRDIGFQRKTGLRDIEQGRVEGLRKAVNNALQRGIFRSGVREFNEGMVERESGEAASDLKFRTDAASGDLKEQIRIALERIANQRKGTAGQKFVGGASSGGGGLSPGFIEEIFKRFNELNMSGGGG